MRDEAGVEAKFGVKPATIPDYLAVLGDSADGFPGVPGWGEKASSLVLSRYGHLENIPKDWRGWDASIGSARRLAASLFDHWEDALLFRTLATLREDAPVSERVDDVEWRGPRPAFEEFCRVIKSPEILGRAVSAVERRAQTA
jgi:5'-3' exonuclease